MYKSNIREEVKIGDQSKVQELLTEQEVKRVIVGVNTTVPRVDGIIVLVLKVVWDKEGTKIYRMFNKVLVRGVHPFKEAKVVLLQKVGRDLSIVKGQRPISLLLVLGKGLERAVAIRLGRQGLKEGQFRNL